MVNSSSDKQRPYLTVPRDEAKQRIAAQIEKVENLPNTSVNENDEVRRWYDFSAELLRQLFTTDALIDEFTNISVYEETNTNFYLKRLVSIHDRLDLYPEEKPNASSLLITSITNIEKLIGKFHTVARQIRYRHNNRSTLEIIDEYDVQDLFHALLKLHFEDVRPEEWTPSYAGNSSRMDFLLKAEKIVVEVKKTRKGLGAKAVGEQLAVDIIKYRSHPDCKTLICFIYDPDEYIMNPKGLERDLCQPIGELKVKVYVAQK